jgi:hypothetical protein
MPTFVHVCNKFQGKKRKYAAEDEKAMPLPELNCVHDAGLLNATCKTCVAHHSAIISERMYSGEKLCHIMLDMDCLGCRGTWFDHQQRMKENANWVFVKQGLDMYIHIYIYIYILYIH